MSVRGTARMWLPAKVTQSVIYAWTESARSAQTTRRVKQESVPTRVLHLITLAHVNALLIMAALQGRITYARHVKQVAHPVTKEV